MGSEQDPRHNVHVRPITLVIQRRPLRHGVATERTHFQNQLEFFI